MLSLRFWSESGSLTALLSSQVRQKFPFLDILDLLLPSVLIPKVYFFEGTIDWFLKVYSFSLLTLEHSLNSVVVFYRYDYSGYGQSSGKVSFTTNHRS